MEMITVACPKCKGSLQADAKQERIFCMYCRAEVKVKKEKKSRGATATSLIKKGFLALEHQEWGKARKSLNKAAEMEPENAQIYVGLLMAETGTAKEEELGLIENNHSHILINGDLHSVSIASLSQLINYQKAERFADSELKMRLNAYNDQLMAIEAEVKERKGWKMWIGAMLHAIIYPLVLVEIMSLLIEGHFSILNLTIFGSSDGELVWIVSLMFALIWIIALCCIYLSKKKNIRNKIVEEFRKKERTVNISEASNGKKKAGFGVGAIVALVIIGSAITLFFIMGLGSDSSGVHFTDERVQISHGGLTFEIPENINPSRSDNNVLAMHFNEDGSIWANFEPHVALESGEELEAFKNRIFANHANLIPTGAYETMSINGVPALLQEATNQNGRNLLVFMKGDADHEAHIMRFHAREDSHFETYRPYFIEILESIR